MNKINLTLFLSLVASSSILGMEEQKGSSESILAFQNAKQNIHLNYLRPRTHFDSVSFFDKYRQKVDPAHYKQQVNTFIHKIKNKSIKETDAWKTIVDANQDIMNLKLSAPQRANSLQERQSFHFWKTMRRAGYTLAGAIFTFYGGMAVHDTLEMQRKPQFVASGIFTGLVVAGSIAAVKSGKDHWSQYKDTQRLREAYNQNVVTPLTELENVD